MRVLKATDLNFFFGGPSGGYSGHDPKHWSCGICAKKFYDHGLSVVLENGTHRGPWVGELCGECLTSRPKDLADFARVRTKILRQLRPRRGDDANTNTKWADDLLIVADLFDKLDSLDAIPGGVLARKIGEGYRELDNRPKARKGKAA
jgi:hypothetical protein